MSSKKDKNKQFEKFCEAFKKAHPLIVKNVAHKEAMKQWNDLKKLKNPETAISEKMQEFRLKEARLKTIPKKQTLKNLEIDKQFENFCEAFKKAHPALVKNTAHNEALKQWNDLKKMTNSETAIREKMQEYRLTEARLKPKPKKQTWKNLDIDSRFQSPYSNFFAAQQMKSML